MREINIGLENGGDTFRCLLISLHWELTGHFLGFLTIRLARAFNVLLCRGLKMQPSIKAKPERQSCS